MSSVPSIVPSIDPTKPADGGSMSARERACSLAEAHFGALFGVQRFELVDVRRTIDWLGRERFVVDADVGFAHARVRSLVDPKRARVLEVSHYAHPVPYGELPMITADEALEIARTEVDRLGWTVRTRRGGAAAPVVRQAVVARADERRHDRLQRSDRHRREDESRDRPRLPAALSAGAREDDEAP